MLPRITRSAWRWSAVADVVLEPLPTRCKTTGGPVKLVAMADLFDNRLQGSLASLKQQFPDQVDVPPERQFLGFDAYRQAIEVLGAQDVVVLTTHGRLSAHAF